MCFKKLHNSYMAFGAGLGECGVPPVVDYVDGGSSLAFQQELDHHRVPFRTSHVQWSDIVLIGHIDCRLGFNKGPDNNTVSRIIALELGVEIQGNKLSQ